MLKIICVCIHKRVCVYVCVCVYSFRESEETKKSFRVETIASVFCPIYTIAREDCPLLLNICDFLVDLIDF